MTKGLTKEGWHLGEKNINVFESAALSWLFARSSTRGPTAPFQEAEQGLL